MNLGASDVRQPKAQTLIISLAACSAFVVLLCILFDPRWETNDDVAMSMVAHGYGLAAYGSPHIIFSNVIWGVIVRTVPSIGGVFGYSLAMLGAITLAASAILYFLVRLGAGYAVGLLVIALILLLPVLQAQFTITAGFLTAAAALGVCAYQRTGSTFILVASTVLALLGFLVRNLEFALVALVALPILPWGMLRKDRKFQAAAAVLVSGVAGATWIDQFAYSGSEWNYFWELNLARAPFTDFGVADRLLEAPEIMARHGMSKNDVELLKHYFFADRQLADPARLRAVLADLAPVAVKSYSFASGLISLRSIFDSRILAPLVAAMVLLLLAFERRAIVSWIISVAVIFALGVAGRHGILRVYVPMFMLLLFIPFLSGRLTSGIRRAAMLVVLAIACLVNARVLIAESRANSRDIDVATVLGPVPAEPVVVWGGAFPFEISFPLFPGQSNSRNLKMFGLGVFTWAPFSVAVAEESASRGLVSRLRSDEGILLVADAQQKELLGPYCAEHFGGQLKLVDFMKTTVFTTILKVTCVEGAAKQAN
jgi:hypothetical protein